MKGTIQVRRLNKSGRYVSGLDWDDAFKGKDNPRGLFKMVIEPIEGEIRYKKIDGGYLVDGEAYIISAGSEREIDEKIRERHHSKLSGTVYVEMDK